MTALYAEMNVDSITVGEIEGDEAGGYAFDGEATVRISNEAAENGLEQGAGPFTWLNSAWISTNPEDDSVTLAVSVGDPRGAFTMTVRRLPDGRIVLHLPHPKESFAHMPTRALHEGTLEVTTDSGKPVDFSDPPTYQFVNLGVHATPPPAPTTEGTDWNDVFVGSADSLSEAMGDALASATDSGYDLCAEAEYEVSEASDDETTTPELADSHYVALYVREVL